MSNHIRPDDLTEGWPDEPDKDVVEAFARDLQTKLPELPPEALQRIGGQMHDEMAVQRWRQRRLRLAAVTTIAATVLIGLGIWRFIASSDHAKRPDPEPIVLREGPMIRDHYRVSVLATPVVPTPDPITLLPEPERKRVETAAFRTNEKAPLIALDDHRSLFMNE